MMRVCPRCKTNHEGKHSYCKECQSARTKEYYLKTRHQRLEYFMHFNAKTRARKKNIEFDISIEDIVIPTHCPVLGIPLVMTVQKEGWFNHSSPSLDRIDDTKGYIKGNIEVISNRANILKRDGTLEEFQKLVRYMEKYNE